MELSKIQIDENRDALMQIGFVVTNEANDIMTLNAGMYRFMTRPNSLTISTFKTNDGHDASEARDTSNNMKFLEYGPCESIEDVKKYISFATD
jgi:hypothetical protein